MMTAEERHDGRAILGDGDDRGLGGLVAENRPHGPDQDAAGAQADDRAAGGEQPGDVGGGLGEAGVGGAVGAGGAVDLAAGQEARRRSARAALRGPRETIAGPWVMRARACGRR